ncbi:MAG: hypothetical protein NUV77_10530 [Thermoguttaceae bacterium]|jgi:hypothetical protein|nr:hypothetical protein [Thermoguttaceae bacterium]
MAHPLQDRIAELRTRVRRLTALFGASCLIGVALTAALVLGALDYTVRFEDLGLRVLSSLTLLAVIAGTAYRCLYQPLRVALSDVELARHVQRRFPELGDSLATSVEFLRQREDDPAAGSLALRRAVVHRTTAESEKLDFLDVLQRRPARRAAMGAAMAVGVAALVSLLAPTGSRTALARLVAPWSDTAWPQVTHLAVREPVARIARGQTFEVAVVDAEGEDLPHEVRIMYRLDTPAGPIHESEPMRREGDAMVARRENVQRSFSYRAEGGDDRSMPWHRVEVLDPPEIQSLEITLDPPAYSGWPRAPSGKNLRALVGTRVRIAATVTKELVSATVCLDDGRELPASVAPDGLSFAAGDDERPFVVERSGVYWIRLTDRDGLTGASARWEIRAIPDEPPNVAIEQPAGVTFVTPRATVPLRVTAKDDLAVARLWLEYGRSDRATPEPAGAEKAADEAGRDVRQPSADSSAAPKPEAVIELVPKPSDPENTDWQRTPAASGEAVSARYSWSLAALDLRPGTQITLRAVASDFRPQTASSQTRLLSVITPEDLADRLAARQAALVAELTRVVELQRQGRALVEEIETRARQAADADRRELDRLRGAELTQRQVNDALANRTGGVAAHVAALLADLTNNRIDSPDVQRRMQAALSEIDRLSAGELTVIARELTAAIKTMQLQIERDRPADAEAAKDRSAAASLAEAKRNQDLVIASLEQLLDDLARWGAFRRFHRDVGQLLREQQELARFTAEAGRRTLTKDLKDLTPQDRADLSLGARRQLDLAQRFDRLQWQMDEALASLGQREPLAAQAVADALSRARQWNLSGQMRSAGAGIEANQMGRAVALQREIVERLGELLDLLANRREHELGGLVRKLREAEAELAALAAQQDDVRRQLEQAATQADAEPRRRELERLAALQKRLRQQAEEMGRRLERLTAQQAARSVGQAARAMDQAAAQAQGDAGKAAEHARQAKSALDEAQRQAAAQRLQAQADLVTEQLARLEDSVQSLHRRQEKALAETRRLEGLRIAQGRWTAGQDEGLAALSGEQTLLATETAALADQLAGSAAFHLSLSGAARDMGVAAALLERRQTGEPAQRAQQNASRRLAQLIEAIKPDSPAKPPEKTPDGKGEPGGGAGGARPQGGPAGAGLQRLAEIKLLKLMQEDVNRRTRELEKSVGPGAPLSPEARRAYAELGEEQGRLADLLLATVPPEEDTP